MRRLTQVLLITLILGCVGCNEKLIHDLSEHDANKVVSQLHKDGIIGSKVQQADGRWSIEVAKNETVRALSILDSSRVLSRKKSGDVRAKGTSILPTREEQWFQYETQVAGALEMTLLTLPGVIDAHVHLHLPPSDPMLGLREKGGGTGSVLLITDSQNSIQDDDVAKMVSGGAGIPPEQVRVLRSVAVNSSAEFNKTLHTEGTTFIKKGGGSALEDHEYVDVSPTRLLYFGEAVGGMVSILILTGYLLFKKKRQRRDIFKLHPQEPLMT